MVTGFEVKQEFGIPSAGLQKPIQLKYILSILGVEPEFLAAFVKETHGIATPVGELPKELKGLRMALVEFHAINAGGDGSTWDVLARQTVEHADDPLEPLTYGWSQLQGTPANEVLGSTEAWVRTSNATEQVLGHITPAQHPGNDQYNIHALGLVRANEVPGVTPAPYAHTPGLYQAQG